MRDQRPQCERGHRCCGERPGPDSFDIGQGHVGRAGDSLHFGTQRLKTIGFFEKSTGWSGQCQSLQSGQARGNGVCTDGLHGSSDRLLYAEPTGRAGQHLGDISGEHRARPKFGYRSQPRCGNVVGVGLQRAQRLVFDGGA